MTTDPLHVYVGEYLAITRMDDPDRLTPADLEIGAGYHITAEDREEACRRLRLRAAEFKRISPEEECHEVARVLAAVSGWAYKRARQEPCDFHPFPTGDKAETHPDAWPSSLSVRKGSALGQAIQIALQFSNHVHVAESERGAGIGFRRTLKHLGLTDLDLRMTFGGLEFASERDKHWSEANSASVSALAAKVRGTTDVPPHLAADLVRYPTLWMSRARDMDVVWAKKFRKYPRDFTLKQLKTGWDPAMVLALYDLYISKHTAKYRTPHPDEVHRIDDEVTALRTFLAGRGVDVDALLTKLDPS